MGKYENTLKQVQLRNLLSEKKYDKALVMAEEMIAENKVTDITELELFADIYRKCREYKEAKELYSRIYEEIPTRRVLYSLIALCIKSKDIDEAENLYKEYIKKDKTSIDRYILRYRIDKASKAERSVIIKDLEKIKKTDYIEEWAYELAKQYHKAGMIKECIEECRQIIIWFSDGEIAERAKLLKMHHEGNVSDEVMVSLEQYIGSDVSKYMDSASDGITDLDEINESVGDEFKTQIKLPEEAEIMAAKMADINGHAAAEDYSDVELSIGADVSQMIDEETKAEDAVNDAVKEIQEEIASDINEVDDVTGTSGLALSKYAKEMPYITEKEFFNNPKDMAKDALSFVVVTEIEKDVMPTVQIIAKALNRIGRLDSHRIARINAVNLNNVNIENEIDNLFGACVLIEDASLMSMKTINSIIKVIDAYHSKLAIVLTDTEQNMSKMLFKEEVLKNQMKHFIFCE